MYLGQHKEEKHLMEIYYIIVTVEPKVHIIELSAICISSQVFRMSRGNKISKWSVNAERGLKVHYI